LKDSGARQRILEDMTITDWIIGIALLIVFRQMRQMRQMRRERLTAHTIRLPWLSPAGLPAVTRTAF
jgi:hypothetical protein